MCDPLTLLGGITSLIGNKKPKPPPAPARAIEDAQAETGAEVVLGSEKNDDTTKTTNTATTKKSGSALRTDKNVGLSIL